MVLPGHLAASVLCHRYLKVDLKVAIAAALLPDVVDKFLFYVLGVTNGSRAVMHSLLGWVLTTALIAGLGAALAPRGRWGLGWLLSYGAHLLCDSPLVSDDLPFLYPFVQYSFGSARWPGGYLLEPNAFPWRTVVAELALVAVSVALELRRRRVAAPARGASGAGA